MWEEETIKAAVREHYAKLTQGKSCCEPAGCGYGSSADVHLMQIGYSASELGDLPQEAVSMAAGCGNPTALSELRPGEVVLDLGSGGGLDALLAAQRVGPQGRVIGVDMTPEMIERAQESARKANAANVEFRFGEIEDLPLEDASVDVIISNCVINLSPDKEAVFREAFRVLKPGGRMIVSDIVTQDELPKFVRESLAAWAGCVGGALEQEEYLQKIRTAGFVDVEVLQKSAPMGVFPIVSITVRAVKPSITGARMA